MKNRFNLLLGSLVVIAMTQTVHALTWDTNSANGATIDAGSGTWNTILSDPTSANTVWNNGSTNVIWSQTSATVATNSAVFGAPGGTEVGPYAITVAENFAATSLTFNTSGYTLSAAAAQTIISPTITVASGSSAAIGSNLTIKPVDGTSAMTLKGPGTLNINSGATVKEFGGNNVVLSTGVNVNVLTGGLLTASSQFVVGDANGGAQLNVTGGSATLTNTGTGNIVVSNIGSGSGSGTAGLKITGGNVTNSSTTGGLRFGNNTVGTFTNNGTVDLDGGTLTVAKIYEGTGGTTNSTFNFNGGTLKVLTGTTFAATFMTGLNSANVKEGGAFIDTNGVDTTIGQALIHGGNSTDSDGGLTKNGAGTLTLTGANTYKGATTINTGTLTVGTSGTLGTSTAALNVNNTNTGAGNAVALNLATAADTVTGSLSGTIATPSNGTNTATINNGGTGRNFTVNQTTNGTYAGVISGAGSFTLGASSTASLTLTGANNYTGGTTVSAGRLISTRATAGGATAVASGATLEYAIASATNQGASSYTGAGTIQKTGVGTLTLNTASSSFALSAGGLIDVQAGTLRIDGNNTVSFASNLGSLNIASGATFNATASDVIVDQLTGSGTFQQGWFGPRGLEVGISNGSSTFAGTLQGVSSGGIALVKIGTGTLTLTGTVNLMNSSSANLAGNDVIRVTGGTSVSPSTLTLSPTGTSVIGSTAANNTVSIAPSGTDFAVFNQTAGTVNSTSISVGNQGVGTYNLSGGIVNTKAVGLGMNGSSSATASAFLNVSGSSALNVYNNGNITLGQFYSHTVTINQTGGNVSLYSDAGTTLGGTGALAFGGGSNASSYTLSGGTLAIPNITLAAAGGGAGGGSGTINLNGGTLKITSSSFTVPTVASKTVTFNVQGDGAVANSGANIDTYGLDINFNAPLLHSGLNATDGGLTKLGAGTLALSGTNTYTGTTTVSEGTLAIGAGGSIDASSQIIVGANTTLDVSAVAFTLGSTNAQSLSGTGTVTGGITVGANGTLAIGTSPGTMTFNNNLTLGPDSTSDFEITTLTLGGYDLAKAATTGTQTVSFNGGILNLLFQTGFSTEGTVKIFDFDTYAGTGFTSVVSTGLANGYTASFDQTNGIVTVVPEPNAAALLGGFGLLALLRRRRA